MHRARDRGGTHQHAHGPHAPPRRTPAAATPAVRQGRAKPAPRGLPGAGTQPAL